MNIRLDIQIAVQQAYAFLKNPEAAKSVSAPNLFGFSAPVTIEEDNFT